LLFVVLKALKYLLVGVFVWFIGLIFFGNSMNFIGRSEPAQLYVSDLESRKDLDGVFSFRPVFKLASAKSAQKGYAGNQWDKIPPHQVGETVGGRIDPETGEMRSDKMLWKSKWLGWFARAFGALMGVQGLALLLGVPEYRLPLPIGIGHRPKRRLF
jgi:hypothetical protein